MSRWFRMYDELLDDPKVQRLPADDFRGWVNLLCLASRNGGKLPAIADIAFALRETQDGVSTLLERLRSAGLIERRSGGAYGAFDAPYKWAERQYKSDTSTDRVKRFRQRSRNSDETSPETETEAETEETEPKGSSKIDEGKLRAVGECLKAAFVLPDDIPPEPWAAWIEMRRRIRKNPTDKAKGLAVSELRRLRDEEGWPPGDVLNHCTMNSYQGIYPPKRGRDERSSNPTTDAVRRILG